LFTSIDFLCFALQKRSEPNVPILQSSQKEPTPAASLRTLISYKKNLCLHCFKNSKRWGRVNGLKKRSLFVLSQLFYQHL